MHEASLIRSLLSQVEDVRRQHGRANVHEIKIEIGPLSGVESLLVRSAFETLAPEYGMSGARLEIDEVPLSARCPRCGVIAVEPQRIVCPICGSQEMQIVGGDEVVLQCVTIFGPNPQEVTT